MDFIGVSAAYLPLEAGPFGDVNARSMPSRYVYLRDYFRGRVEDLTRHGLPWFGATLGGV